MISPPPVRRPDEARHKRVNAQDNNIQLHRQGDQMDQAAIKPSSRRPGRSTASRTLREELPVAKTSAAKKSGGRTGRRRSFGQQRPSQPKHEQRRRKKEQPNHEAQARKRPGNNPPRANPPPPSNPHTGTHPSRTSPTPDRTTTIRSIRGSNIPPRLTSGRSPRTERRANGNHQCGPRAQAAREIATAAMD